MHHILYHRNERLFGLNVKYLVCLNSGGKATYVAFRIASNKGHNDDALVTSLVFVHSVDFQSFIGISLEQTGDGF